MKVYFPLPYCKKGRGGGKLIFSGKIPSISTWLLPLHPHTHAKRTKRKKKIRSFTNVNLNCWRFCGWSQLNLKSFFHDFGPLASLQIIKDTSGRASALLSYKLTPAKISILHMWLLHLFSMVPDREKSPVCWLSPNKMI